MPQATLKHSNLSWCCRNNEVPDFNCKPANQGFATDKRTILLVDDEPAIVGARNLGSE